MSTMMPPGPDSKSDPAHTPWTDEIRRQAWIAVEIAATARENADRALGYYLRTALAHGIPAAQLSQAADVTFAEFMRLTDPAVAG